MEKPIANAEDSHPIGQYFRDFANFGRPIKPAKSLAAFVARNNGHINITGITLPTKEPNPYAYLILGGLREAWAQIRYIPFVCCRQFHNDHPNLTLRNIGKQIAVDVAVCSLIAAGATMYIGVFYCLIKALGYLASF